MAVHWLKVKKYQVTRWSKFYFCDYIQSLFSTNWSYFSFIHRSVASADSDLFGSKDKVSTNLLLKDLHTTSSHHRETVLGSSSSWSSSESDTEIARRKTVLGSSSSSSSSEFDTETARCLRSVSRLPWYVFSFSSASFTFSPYFFQFKSYKFLLFLYLEVMVGLAKLTQVGE